MKMHLLESGRNWRKKFKKILNEHYLYILELSLSTTTTQQEHITNEEKIIQMAEFAGIRDSLLRLPQQTIAKNAKGENAVGTWTLWTGWSMMLQYEED